MDPDQRSVIESNSKYIAVIATAGSGKTFTLKEKIKNIESNGKKILVISFTNSAVKELKERIEYENKNLEIMNFDSFFLKIFIDYQHLNSGKFLCSEYKLIQSPPKILEEDDFNNALFNNKKLFYTSEQFKKNVLEIISIPEVMNKISSMYSHVFIDEAQDMDFYQLKLIEEIKKDGISSIILFADFNQSIFYFRNARPKLIKEFIDNESFTEFNLKKSYRCPDDIYDIASKFKITNNRNFELEHVFNILNIKTKNYIFVEEHQNDFFSDANLEFRNKVYKEIDFDSRNETAILYGVNKIANDIVKYDNFKHFTIEKIPLTKNNDFDYSKFIKIYFNNDVKEFLNEFDLDHSKKNEEIFAKTTYREYLHEASEKTPDNLVSFLKHISISYLENEVDEKQNDYWQNVIDKFEELKIWSAPSENLLMTYFSSKGLEFKNVIIILSTKGLVSDLKNTNSQWREKIFVALTRAKEKAIVIWRTK